MTPKMTARNVSVHYGSKLAIDDVSIDIEMDRVVAFIGPSGCGKSTFLRTLNRMNDTVANPSLKTKAPEAAAFLEKLSWSAEEVGAVMLSIRDGVKPDEAAKQWIEKNPDRVAEWLK